MSNRKKLIKRVRMIQEAVLDYLDESRDEPSKMTAKLDEYRVSLRDAHIDLEQTIDEDEYTEKFAESRKEITDLIKAKIKETLDAKDTKKTEEQAAEKEIQQAKQSSQDKSLEFLSGELERVITELELFFLSSVKDKNDPQLIQWNEELPDQVKRFDTLAERYHVIIQSPTSNTELEKKITKLGTRYQELASRKKVFVTMLKKEIVSRELGKQDLTKEARLNIKLPKFSGYESEMDIYSYQIEFEKLHLRTVPKRCLPDVLINNFLSEPALSLVKGLDNIDEIWLRLKSSFGDTRMLLSRKLSQLDNIETSGKSKEEKLITKYSRIICVMKDLIKLATKHGIERNLFYGGATEKIYKIMGDPLVNKWLDLMCDDASIEVPLWTKLIAFLERQMKIQQQKMLVTPHKEDKDKENKRGPKGFFMDSDQPTCFICGKSSNHIATNGPGKSKIIQYFACKLFTEKTPSERLHLLKEKGYCIQCLYPGADSSKGKHKKGKCQKEFVCPNSAHERYTSQKHVLLCDEHKQEPENEEVLVLFKSRYISRNTNLPEFSQNIKLAFMANTNFHAKPNNRRRRSQRSADKCESILDRGIYMLQEITVNSQPFTIFYDTGCSDFIVTRDAANRLGPHAIPESSDPVTISGVGDKTVQTSGSYEVRLPLCDGSNAVFNGSCLDKIATPFPIYDLTAASNDLITAAADEAHRLPKLPSSVGGKIDMMIGIRYLKYHPHIIFQLHTGLTIYESVFQGSDGSRGVIGGPHPSFSIHSNFYSTEVNLHLSPQSSDDEESHSTFLSNPLKSFNEAEAIGGEISYRCPSCRECKDCKNHDSTEAISIREDAEQAIINSSVHVDLANKVTTARLPFICDPTEKLLPNKSIALKVYQQQLRKLNKPENANDKQDIIQSEAKLHKLGFVDYVSNLSPEMQEMLRSQPIQNYIPWRAVWKPSSLSTPCRIVFDASQNTPSGHSLNDCLAKGRNGLNHLQEILIRWSIHKVAIHSDVRKMYNTIKLDSQDWCFQRYVWQQDLDPTKIPEEKVIQTLIYGVKPSGNQAEFALREVARLHSDKYPEVSQILHQDVYVDDCITGEESTEKAVPRSKEIEHVVNQGGFDLKGITLSGKKPDEALCDDNGSIIVAGFKWLPEEDVLSLNLGNLNFARKC